MKVEKQRIDPVRLLIKRLALLGCIILLIIGSFGLWHTYQEEQASLRLRNDAQAHLQGLQQRQKTLSGDIALLTTDRGREAVLRSQYALGKPGEHMMIIINGPAPMAATDTPSVLKTWFKKAFSWW
ncbi:MAG: hypothetical protein JWO50_283 [Candidatus Kaiserbacteria bacterium]|nr:hypothetical protein [Candidatus Kaiserbacteria bacterium]